MLVGGRLYATGGCSFQLATCPYSASATLPNLAVSDQAGSPTPSACAASMCSKGTSAESGFSDVLQPRACCGGVLPTPGQCRLPSRSQCTTAAKGHHRQQRHPLAPSGQHLQGARQSGASWRPWVVTMIISVGAFPPDWSTDAMSARERSAAPVAAAIFILITKGKGGLSLCERPKGSLRKAVVVDQKWPSPKVYTRPGPPQEHQSRLRSKVNTTNFLIQAWRLSCPGAPRQR